MKLVLPKDIFKNVPKKAWVYLFLGFMGLLLMLGATFLKFGGIFIKIEKAVEEDVEDKPKIRFDENGNLIQDILPGTKVKKTKDGIEILKGGPPE